MSEMPSDVAVALRELLAAFSGGAWPLWFTHLEAQRGYHGWRTALSAAIAEIERARKGGGEELEQMKQLNGRLIRRLAGD